SPDEKDVYKIVRAVRDLFEGRSNAIGSFTLKPSAGSTTVTAPNCGAGSTVLPFAKTANAAAEIGNGTMDIGAVNNGSLGVTHANTRRPIGPFSMSRSVEQPPALVLRSRRRRRLEGRP